MVTRWMCHIIHPKKYTLYQNMHQKHGFEKNTKICTLKILERCQDSSSKEYLNNLERYQH